MKINTFERELRLAQPRDEVFAFFARPENLARITPPSMGFEILTPSPVAMKAGALIDYSVRILGVTTHWRSLISSYDPPCQFIDEQLKGPYVFWHHTHTFIKHRDGTLIRDSVKYVLPFGWLGVLLHRLVVKRQLEAIFNYRTEIIKDAFSVRSDRLEIKGESAGRR